jgi:hypothetical protein
VTVISLARRSKTILFLKVEAVTSEGPIDASLNA